MKSNNGFSVAALAVGIVLGSFYLLMALDAFPTDFTGKSIGGYLINSIPGIVVVLATVIGFKKQLIGVILFLIITIVTIFFFHTYEHALNMLLISFPPIIIATLFAFSYRRTKSKN